jgi:hypothetical protein
MCLAFKTQYLSGIDRFWSMKVSGKKDRTNSGYVTDVRFYFLLSTAD